jgi:hypothetical protein
MKFYRFHPDYDNLFILVPLSGSKFNYHGQILYLGQHRQEPLN